MLVDNRIVYVAPPFEEVQNESVVIDENNKVRQANFHSDLSLLMRINNMSLSAKTYETIKDALQPLIDKSSFRQDIEEAFGSLTDDDLIKSCPSRYLSTASEQKEYLRSLADNDKQVKETARKAKVKAEEDSKRKQEDEEFSEALRSYLSNF